MAAPTTSTSASKTYLWSGIDSTGRRVSKQKIVAPNQAAVVSTLKKDGFLATDVREVSSTNWNISIGATGVKFGWKQKAEFARRLFQLLRAGISTSRALASLAEDAKPAVAAMCLDMSEKVASGKSLSEAMAEHPRAFDTVFCSYVQAGEESGTLVECLGRLSTLMAKRAAMQSKINGVTAYPKMVGAAVGVIVVLIIGFLLPHYEKIYASFDAELPAPTLALMWVSDRLWPVDIKFVDLGVMPMFVPIPQPFNIMSIIGYLIVGWLVFRHRTKDNEAVGAWLDEVKFRTPVLGPLAHKGSLFRWASTLAGALASGLPMTRALELSAAASGSVWQQVTAQEFMSAVRSGRTISQAMAGYPRLYPPSVRTMLATGEDTGEAAEMLGSVALSLDEDVDSIVAGLSAQLEVALLLILGGVVGGLLVVLYLPMLQLAVTATEGFGAA